MKRAARFLKKPENIFLCIVGGFGLLSVFLMPILNTPDENQHFQVVYGMFTTHEKNVPKGIIESEESIRASVEENNYNRFFEINEDAKNDGVQINFDKKVFGDVKSSVTDIVRLPSALGVLLARSIYPSMFFMVIFGRIINLAIFVIAIYFVIKKSKHGKWAILAIACIPMAIQQAASLSYDGINFVAVIAWIAFCYNLWVQKKLISKKQIATMFGLLLALLITKPNNVMFVLLLLAVPKSVYKDLPILRKVRKSKNRKLIYILSAIFAGALVAAAGFVLGKRFLAGQEFHLLRLLKVLGNTLFLNISLINVTAVGVFGQFGNFNYSLPIWVIFGNIMAIICAFLYESQKFTKRQIVVATGMFVISVLTIMVGMYYAWAMKPARFGELATITDGIQGRYFTPFLMLLVPITTYLFGSGNKKKRLKIAALAGIVFSLLVYIAQTILIVWIFKWEVL